MSKPTWEAFVKKVYERIKYWRKETLLKKRAESLKTNRSKKECNLSFRYKVRNFRCNNDPGYLSNSSTMHTSDFQNNSSGSDDFQNNSSGSDDETTDGGRQDERQSVEIYVNKS